MRRYCQKFSNIFPFPVEEQNCCFEPKKISKLKMKTRPKKVKKYSHTKDCKEQPREVCDQYEGNYPEEEKGGEEECEERCKEVKRNDPEGEKNEEEEESRKEVKWNDPEEEGKEVDDEVDQEGEAKTDAHRYWEKFSNIFPFPVEKQNCHFEPKKICEVKMKTHPKKAKKYNYTKDSKEQPRKLFGQGLIWKKKEMKLMKKSIELEMKNFFWTIFFDQIFFGIKSFWGAKNCFGANIFWGPKYQNLGVKFSIF